MREIPIFIASSVREFEQERQELFSLLDTLNETYGKRGAKLLWNPPETNSRTLSFGGKQLDFDAFIPISEFFILIIGERVGYYTRHEYDLALERFKRTRRPKILPCFLKTASKEVREFRDSIRQAEIGIQYVDFYRDFDDIKNQIRQELTEYVVNSAEADDDEAEADNYLNRIKRKIHTLHGEIEHLNTLTVTQETVTEITYQYAEMERLVRKYKVEPDSLDDYLKFLHRQNLYDTAIELGHWLESFYKLENPGDRAWATLAHELGVCYKSINHYEQAEQYYQAELLIWRKLKDEPWIAQTCNNLGILLKNINRMEEAERYCREALKIRRRLASANPIDYEPSLAHTCNNLGYLLDDTSRKKEAERYYREALEIWRRLASVNSLTYELEVAHVCNNLAYLFIVANEMEVAVSSEQIIKAEPYLQEALKIKRRYAAANPNAYKPDMAVTLYNLGVLEYKRNQPDAATPYFEESLAIFEEFPHFMGEKQMCRDAIDKLQRGFASFPHKQ